MDIDFSSPKAQLHHSNKKELSGVQSCVIYICLPLTLT